MRWVQDLIFSRLLAHFSSFRRAIYPSWQSICLPCPTYEYAAFSNSPYFLFNIIRLVFPDLFQLLDVPLLLARRVIGWDPAGCSDSISLLTWPVTILPPSRWPLLLFSSSCFSLIRTRQEKKTVRVKCAPIVWMLPCETGCGWVCISPAGVGRRDCVGLWPSVASWKLVRVLRWADGHCGSASPRGDVYLEFYIRVSANFFCKEPHSRIVSLSGHTVSLATTHWCCYSAKAANDNA